MTTHTSRYGYRILWYFVAFFGLIAAVNAVMVTLALRTHTGVITEHAYEKGLAYNQVVEAANAQAALGYTASITYEAGNLAVMIRDARGISLPLHDAKAYLRRPANHALDFVKPLSGASTPLALPAPGNWEVRVEAVVEGQPYQHTQRIVAHE
jgi:nitrogen fixation protein FixH